jgi:hypothetical protein
MWSYPDQYTFGQNLSDAPDSPSMQPIRAQEGRNRLDNILSYAGDGLFRFSEIGVPIDRHEDSKEVREPELHETQLGELQGAHSEAIESMGGAPADRAPTPPQGGCHGLAQFSCLPTR